MQNPKHQALSVLAELRAELNQLIQLHNQCMQSSSALAAANQGGTSGGGQAHLSDATKQMQEMNQSFNPQYLHIQQKMQADNRQFTLLSNIMKTKHDTAKAAINNVR